MIIFPRAHGLCFNFFYGLEQSSALGRFSCHLYRRRNFRRREMCFLFSPLQVTAQLANPCLNDVFSDDRLMEIVFRKKSSALECFSFWSISKAGIGNREMAHKMSTNKLVWKQFKLNKMI